MAKTKIEWATDVWNPVTGCSPISEGCLNCYAKRMANRLRGRFGYPKDDPFKVTFHPDRLDQPLKWKKPRRMFVCSMGDLFHEDVEDHQINSIFLKMLNIDWHTFMILTKRPERMKDFISIGTGWRGMMENLWLGVTVEHPDYLWRIDELSKIPAAVRFVSLEPMLEAVDLSKYLNIPDIYETEYFYAPKQFIDWIICGAETGPRARPMKLNWARDLRNQCQPAGVPFFFKSAGKQEMPDDLMVREFPEKADHYLCPNCGDRILKPEHCYNPHCRLKRKGREFPK